MPPGTYSTGFEPRSALAGPAPGCRVQGSGCRVQGSGCRVQGSGFRVQGLGFRVLTGFEPRPTPAAPGLGVEI